MADINSKYFSVLQSSNFKHSSSYGSNLKCGKTGKDEEFIGHFEIQLVLAPQYHPFFVMLQYFHYHHN
ncbi:MAG: hypothetical protein U9R32_02420, partial [Bacteroidota bacterium]|nr:hypothetical protein [Bacteroidota bacterium]